MSGRDSKASEFEMRGDYGCWAIADGVDRPGRSPASLIAVDAVLKCASRSFELASDAVRGCLLDARVAARQGQRSLALGAMGTRLALLVTDSRAATWGSVGDSHIYHLRGGRHAAAAASSDGAEMHVHHSALVVNDAFLLCTSGWWEQLTEPEMEFDLAKAADPNEWLEIMAERILQRGAVSDGEAMGIFV
jgi:serine/threonine protein phosphatase PrpC